MVHLLPRGHVPAGLLQRPGRGGSSPRGSLQAHHGGGGAHTDTFGGSGLKAVSINAASHVLHVPAYFRLDRRPLFLAWLAERGLDPDGPSEPPFSVDAEASRTPTKWPKEVKPSLSAVMQDNAVFNRAARRLSTAVFAIGDDAADYFNQLFMATP